MLVGETLDAATVAECRKVGIGVEEHEGVTYFTGWRRPTLADQVPDMRVRTAPMTRYRVLVRWFGLGWYGVPPQDRFYLVKDEPEPVNRHWDAFLAGYAERLCRLDGLEPPEWVRRPERYLDHYWIPEESSAPGVMRSHIDAPAPWLAERGVLSSDQSLLDAKYLVYKDYISLGYGDRTEPRRASREDLDTGDIRERAVLALGELAKRLKWRRVGAGIYWPTVDGRVRGHPVVSEYQGYGERNILRGLELELAHEYGWADRWVDSAAGTLQIDSSAVRNECSGVLFYRPGLTVGFTPVSPLLSIRAMAAKEGGEEDLAQLIVAAGVVAEEELEKLVKRWFPHSNSQGLPPEQRGVATRAFGLIRRQSGNAW